MLKYGFLAGVWIIIGIIYVFAIVATILGWLFIQILTGCEWLKYQIKARYYKVKSPDR